MNKRILTAAVIALLSVTGPAEAEDRFFDSNGVRIRYVHEGSGQPIVLVHGILGSVENNWVETGVIPKLSHLQIKQAPHPRLLDGRTRRRATTDDARRSLYHSRYWWLHSNVRLDTEG